VILGIIQARMNSARLPGKSMALLSGVPLLEHVIRRAKAAPLIEKLCVATTVNAEDDVIAAHVESLGVDVFRGEAENVLSRFFWTANRYDDAHVIVRLTADDPFKDPDLITQALVGFLSEWASAANNPDHTPPPPQYMHLGGSTWPVGLDVEIFTRPALVSAFHRATEAYDQEHVTPWMRNELGVWTMKDTEKRKTDETRWTIDTPDDLVFAQAVYDQLYHTKPLFGYADLIEAGY
jgi:spore coat polysaccharide biosynthesis protein SpsF